MSELGQKRKCPGSCGTSVLPSGADIVSLPRHLRLVPIAEAATPSGQGAEFGLVLKASSARSARAGGIYDATAGKGAAQNAQDFTGRFESEKRTATKPILLDPDSNFV
jgi:hypothetical protein